MAGVDALAAAHAEAVQTSDWEAALELERELLARDDDEIIDPPEDGPQPTHRPVGERE